MPFDIQKISMNEDQTKLANEISEILKDKNLSAEERLKKMRAKLEEKKFNPNETKTSSLDTYDNQSIKKAALRNAILNKKPE